MGQTGRAIVKMDVEELINDLNKALAAEGLDAYRYRLLAKMAAGLNAAEVAETFEEIGQHEWQHLGVWMERVLQLGGVPLTRTSDWEKHSYTQYREPPSDPTDITRMIEDSLEGERAAIKFYDDLYRKTQHTDPVTAMLAAEALKDEVGDEDRLEQLLGRTATVMR